MDKIKECAAVTIRQPSTANLMVDSADRSTGTWSRFIINRENSILNGFFNRIGVTEMVLEWSEPNILQLQGKADITVVVGGISYTVTLEDGFYTIYSAFEALVDLLNALAIPGTTWTFSGLPGQHIFGAGDDFDVVDTPLARRMAIYDPLTDGTPARFVVAPDLRPYRYLDFVSSSLSVCQELKDASTAPLVRDVLLRWYFGYDGDVVTDPAGYPQLMGYTPFVLRRIYNPPKQIKWDVDAVVGQLTFEVYTDDGVIAPETYPNNFLMTLQVSEN